MNRIPTPRVAPYLAVVMLVGITLLAPAIAQSKNDPSSKAPRDRDLRQGEIVYVDDGKCPKGEIKQVIGGNKEKGVERQSRCVKRPDAPAS